MTFNYNFPFNTVKNVEYLLIEKNIVFAKDISLKEMLVLNDVDLASLGFTDLALFNIKCDYYLPRLNIILSDTTLDEKNKVDTLIMRARITVASKLNARFIKVTGLRQDEILELIESKAKPLIELSEIALDEDEIKTVNGMFSYYQLPEILPEKTYYEDLDWLAYDRHTGKLKKPGRLLKAILNYKGVDKNEMLKQLRIDPVKFVQRLYRPTLMDSDIYNISFYLQIDPRYLFMANHTYKRSTIKKQKQAQEEK